MAAQGPPDANDPYNVTYQFKGEDHTLGNAMRYMIMKSPDVEFAGYTVPHPSEPYMNLRVQTYESKTTDAVVTEALDNIIAVCDHVGKTYRKAVKKHKQLEKATAESAVAAGSAGSAGGAS
mmetsp:Transcript_9053/g.16975  ORF Transcript_9053/g.16975 Transcript_9053/m.16975 type:complete len:121 (+) Transcript_9053:142-504(+)